jgi:tetratricopeptide (TPR) repeat protein
MPVTRRSSPKKGRPLRRLMVLALCVVGLGWTWSQLPSRLVTQGVAAYKRSDWREASRLAQERLKTAPDDLRALRLLARATARMGSFDQARSLQARLDERDLEAEDYCVMGLGWNFSGQPIEAQTALRQALRVDPDHAESLFLLGLATFQRSQWIEATWAAERLSRRPGWEARGNLLLGMIRAADNDPVRAVASLQLALSQDPTIRLFPTSSFSTQRLLARSLLQAERPAEAREILIAVLDAGPDREAAWLLSRAYLQEGDKAKATAALERSGTYGAEHPLEPEPAPYVGEARCVECHREIAQAVLASRHARTFRAGRDLADLPLPESPLTDPDNPHVRHVLKRVDGQVQVETQLPDHQVLRAVVDYALGSNDRYMSLIGLDQKGQARTLRHSYYRSTEGSGWDRTKGHAAHPRDDDEFLGERFTSDDEHQACLVCHVTSARATRERAGPEASDRAIGCERCHGPGGLHLAAIGVKFSDSAIASPAQASPQEINQSCGICHSQHFLEMPASRTAPDWTRFPGSTLPWSRCFRESGGALSCVTCHDPHRNAETRPVSYESKCLSCHASAAPSAKAAPASPRHADEAFRSPCPVNPSRDCLQCHMPKVRYDWLHGSFTDHYIRVHTDKTSGAQPGAVE